MKKTLKKALVLLLALAMVLGLATTTFASDNIGEQQVEEVVSEQLEAAEIVNNIDEAAENTAEPTAAVEPGGKYAGISSEIMAVIEDLDEGQDYVEGELLVIYESAESAEFAVSSMCANGEEASQSCEADTVKVTFDENEISMEDKIIELSKEENVKYVQPNYLYSLIDGMDYYKAYEEMAEMMTTRITDVVNDSKAFMQYYLSQVHMAEAWTIVNKYGTSKKVKVAVIDTGAQINHEDFTNLNTDLCVCVEGSSIPQYPYYEKQTIDDHGHGSNVTGIIGATANNGKGIVGGATLGMIDPSSKLELFSIDAFTYYGSNIWKATSENVCKALVYAADMEAKVISMSLGSRQTSTQWQDNAMKNGIDYAYSKGCICVCAAGNENYNSDYISTYPSDYNKVISVIALDTIWIDEDERTIGEYAYNSYTRTYFSNYGHAQDISAPGMNIYSVANSSSSAYGFMSGTSQATPVVSSIIALMFMMNPNLTFDQVYSIVTSTATDLVYDFVLYNPEEEYWYRETTTEGFDIYTAYGMINAEACVLALAPEVFADVHKADWFYAPVAHMYYRGIMTGLTATNFGPYDQLHREQLAVMLWRLEGKPSVQYESRFYDVPQGTWYTDPIIWAYKNGIITGYENGYFGVGDNITREQLATMLYRYAKYKFPDYYEGVGYADITGYNDAYAVSSWARVAIEWAVGNEIITGKDNGTRIDPQGNAARCECATMLQRFMNNFKF